MVIAEKYYYSHNLNFPSFYSYSSIIFPSVSFVPQTLRLPSPLYFQLNNLELAVNLAKNGNLPGAENLGKKKEVNAARYITKSQVVKYLQVSLSLFRYWSQ